ncbi:testis-specific serine/threonine-protein kinase 3 isoform X2 [Hyperolius riggenbachi]|uniref:testis-specific serine/threonine-protein kinase 3 isoform X2 n=1 Tax=Hyperolius riggenbachi TaxID=752182 RepID=UPI0035A3D21E
MVASNNGHAEQCREAIVLQLPAWVHTTVPLLPPASLSQRQNTAFIQKFLPRELHIVPTLHHKNIIEVYKIIEAGYHRTYMIMELADGGDIFDHIIKNGAFPEDDAQTLFHQLVEAIHYLHNRGVAHRDLKCENTLLDHGVLKLTDFGFAKILPTSTGELTHTFCGSLAYAAPEVLQGVPHDSRKGDIWSMGVLLYVMLSATLPFHDHNIPKMLVQQQRSVMLPDHIHLSEDCRDLVKRLLEPNAVLRPSINEVIRHPWLNHY